MADQSREWHLKLQSDNKNPDKIHQRHEILKQKGSSCQREPAIKKSVVPMRARHLLHAENQHSKTTLEKQSTERRTLTTEDWERTKRSTTIWNDTKNTKINSNFRRQIQAITKKDRINHRRCSAAGGARECNDVQTRNEKNKSNAKITGNSRILWISSVSRNR